MVVCLILSIVLNVRDIVLDIVLHGQKNLTSTKNGRRKILEAVSIRQDVDYDRLQNVKSIFKYHTTNDCYNSYTMKKTLEIMQVGLLSYFK